MPKVGDPLPAPYDEWALERRFGVLRTRGCRCGYRWRTVELPMFEKWGYGLANCCPEHQDVVGKILDSVDAKAYDRSKFKPTGPTLARRVGAVYRRYACRSEKCIDRRARIQRRRKYRGYNRKRWSTLEVMAAGVVVADVTLCPQCKSKGRVVVMASGQARRLPGSAG